LEGLLHPRDRVNLTRKLYLLLVTAGLAAMIGWVMQDAEQTLAAEALPAAAKPVTIQPLTTGKAMDGFGAWSPDGRRIAFMRDGRIWLMNADASQPRALTATADVWDAVPVWRPDGKEIDFARIGGGSGETQGQLVGVDPDTGKERTVLQETQPISHVTWDPQGRTLYYATTQRLMRFDPAAGKATLVYAVPENWELQAGGLAVTPGGKQLIFGAGPRVGRGVQYDLWTLDLTRKQAERERLTTGGGIMPALDAAGRRLAYRNPRGDSGIYVMDLVRHQTTRVVPDEGRALYFHPAFSPDGKQLLISRLLLGSSGGGPDGTRLTSHLYLHTLAGSGGNK
jgi:Tol biopolymer transport system component